MLEHLQLPLQLADLHLAYPQVLFFLLQFGFFNLLAAFLCLPLLLDLNQLPLQLFLLLLREFLGSAHCQLQLSLGLIGPG